MIFVGALCAAVFAYLATGYLTGYAPPHLSFRLSPRRPEPKVSRQVWLTQAGARVTPLQFWATSLGAALFAFVVVFGIAGTAVVALLPACGVAALPRAFYARQRVRLAEDKVKAWPDALRNLSANLSASLSLHQALVALGHSGPTALRPVFQRYTRLAGTLDQRAALQVIREELADPVSDRIVEVLILASEQGPSIVLDVLADLARSTNLDLQLLERMETAQFEQKLNARAVFALPYFILILLCATGEEFRSFYGTAVGFIVVAVGAGLSTGGMLLIRRLGRMPIEERLFVSSGEAAR